MPKSLRLLIGGLLLAFNCCGQAPQGDSVKLSFDIPAKAANGKGVAQTLFYMANHAIKVSLHIICKQIRAKDSLTAFDVTVPKSELAAGTHSLILPLYKHASDKGSRIDADFSEVITGFEIVPPGQYLTIVTILKDGTDSIITSKNLLTEIDSNLATGSSIRQELNKAMTGLNPQQLAASEATNLRSQAIRSDKRSQPVRQAL